MRSRLYWLKNSFEFDVYYQVKEFKGCPALENKVNIFDVDKGKNKCIGFTNYVIVDPDDEDKFVVATFFTQDKGSKKIFSHDAVEAKDVKFWLKQLYSSCIYIKEDLGDIKTREEIVNSDMYKKQFERLKYIAESGDYKYYDGHREKEIRIHDGFAPNVEAF